MKQQSPSLKVSPQRTVEGPPDLLHGPGHLLLPGREQQGGERHRHGRGGDLRPDRHGGAHRRAAQAHPRPGAHDRLHDHHRHLRDRGGPGLEGHVPGHQPGHRPYVGLIITNCILMGRAEAFYVSNGVGLSIIDAIFNGLGYTYTLVLVSVIRESAGLRHDPGHAGHARRPSPSG